jgi:hypothetical protein
MQRSTTTAWLAVATTVLAVCAVAPAAFATPPEAPLKIAADGRPDINAGIDTARLKDNAYVEALSAASEKLSTLQAKITKAVGAPDELIDFGHVPASNDLIVYWSGSLQAPALTRIQQLAKASGTGVIVAVRTVSKARLSAATDYLAANPQRYKGITLSGYGGFSADFDGIHVFVDPDTSAVRDPRAVEATLEADLGIPVKATIGGLQLASGKYDDFAPYNGGGIMLANDGGFCTTGFGVIYGASVHRYLSARHCIADPYRAPSGATMGNQILVGTGFNGAAVYNAAGSHLVFDGSNVGNPTSTRILTQRDPGLSTVGTVVCQEGANMGQQCGPIRQVALLVNDGFGNIRVNYVTNYNATIFTASGDSGAAVVSLHTLGRAWAVGILQGFFENEFSRIGPTCGARVAPTPLPGEFGCGNNFVFTNVDYALSGFTAYGINYY